MGTNGVPFGDWLRLELGRRGIEPPEFAVRIGVPPATVNRWLNGRRLPSSDSAHMIAIALQLHPDTVLERAGHRKHDPNERHRREAIASRRYYEAYRELRDLRERLDRVLREMEDDAPYSVNGKG
jgi:transcriptional regulator with XRE-family HTH domain